MGVLEVLARNWWLVLLRGILAIAFGLIALFYPAAALLGLVLFFAAYVFVDGIFAIIAAFRGDEAGNRFWLLLLEGVTGIIIGVLTLLLPGVTLLALIYLMAAWAVVFGIARIITAVEVRRQVRNEWLLILNGILSVLLGVLLFAYPSTGAVAIIRVFGFFVALFGVILIVASFRIRGWRGMPMTEERDRTDRRVS